MRRRLAVAPFLKGACIAAALAAWPSAQAASVQAVFSAENALYGAGYNIGQADGWIDDKLREALRQFQSDRPGLVATGELDSDTLDALGISGHSSELMSGNNAVASREAARQELGLVIASLAKPDPEPAPEPQPRSKPEPKPAPEPVVAAVSAPEPKPEPAPEPVVVEKAAPSTEKAPESRPEPTPEPQVATAKPEPVEPEPAEPTRAQQQSEPEPTSEPIRIASITRTGSEPVKPEQTGTEQAVSAGAGDKSVEVAGVDNNVAVIESGETTQGLQEVAEQPGETGSAERSVSSESSGNFLTKMFDFLFGWMV